MSKIANEWVGGALFIGRPYTPAVPSADVCMTVHCSAYQRCDENDGAFQRLQPLKGTAGVRVKTVRKLPRSSWPIYMHTYTFNEDKFISVSILTQIYHIYG